MPPIMVATWWPTGNSPPGHWATTPAASVPRTRSNVTPDARPWRVCNSDRFSPNALTSISTQPAAGVGTVSSRIVSESGGPGPSRTIARMVSVIQASYLLCRIGVLPRGLVKVLRSVGSRGTTTGQATGRQPQKSFLYTLDIRSVAEYFSSRCEPVRRAISARPFRQSGHTYLGGMVMSGTPLLPPPHDPAPPLFKKHPPP